MRLTFSLFAVFGVLSASWAADAPTFEKDVLPLLKDRCFSCHGVEQPKAGLDLRTRAAMLKGGRGGPALVPGSLKESLLWINVTTDKMPADKRTVSDAEKDMLRRWILAGAPGEGVVANSASAAKGTEEKRPLAKLGPAEVAKRIDREVAAKLAEAKLPASPPADDATFLRRVSIDLTGRIPSAERTLAFLNDTRPDKRSRLIDELLASPEYGQHFGNVWAKLITVEEPQLKDGLEKWLAARFNENTGWDAVVRDLVTANGAGPETAFVMANVDNKVPQPAKLAASTSRLFLGLQLQCAECHNHPFVDWKQTDFWGLAAFFSYTRSPDKKQLAEIPPGVNKNKPALPPPGSMITLPATAGRGAGKKVEARFLTGEKPELAPEGPFRPALAEWMTAADNPFFAQAAANRLWANFFGRGLVDPVDDLNADNPATHPDSLRVLADEFRASGHDLKHLVRCICLTEAYQRSSRPSPENREDGELYSHMATKVMTPEAFYDSLVFGLGVKELPVTTGVGATSGVGGNKAQTSKIPARERFVRFFNTRDLEGSATDYTHGIPQALSLMNDPAFAQKPPLLDRLTKADPEPAKVIEGLYLALLNRRPTAAERKTLGDYVTRQSDPGRGYSGIVWVLINSPEFVLVR